MKRQKLWVVALAALAVTLLTGFVPNPTIGVIPGYASGGSGLPLPWWGMTTPITGTPPVWHYTFNFFFLVFDIAGWFCLLWLLNRFLLKKRK